MFLEEAVTDYVCDSVYNVFHDLGIARAEGYARVAIRLEAINVVCASPIQLRSERVRRCVSRTAWPGHFSQRCTFRKLVDRGLLAMSLALR